MSPQPTQSAALLAYYAVLLVAVFVWPTWRLWRRERINGFVLPSDDTAEGVIGIWFKGLIGAVGALVAALALGTSHDVLGRLPWAEGSVARVVGWVLLAISLAWMVVAQHGMGRSWRIGIDQQQRGPLVRAGLFALSRNPIFLGLRLNLLGLLLVALYAVIRFAVADGIRDARRREARSGGSLASAPSAPSAVSPTGTSDGLSAATALRDEERRA